MAFDQYDKFEQSEIVQKWLRDNGLSIIVGIAIGLVGIFGWQAWRNHQARNESAAATLYQQLRTALAGGKTTLATQELEQLKSDYAKSSYALFAAGDQARQQVQDNQLDKAQASLQWAVDHAQDPVLKSLTQLRLAQVELARGDGNAALATLDLIPANDYRGLAQELRGDALVKLGRPDDARHAYEAALSAIGAEAPQRGALQMKLDDLAVAGKQGA